MMEIDPSRSMMAYLICSKRSRRREVRACSSTSSTSMPGPPHLAVERVPVVYDHQRSALGGTGEERHVLLQQRQSDVHHEQGGDDRERVGDREVVSEQGLLGRLPMISSRTRSKAVTWARVRLPDRRITTSRNP
jgi:hypothetical protein